jgi:hypothetical protein
VACHPKPVRTKNGRDGGDKCRTGLPSLLRSSGAAPASLALHRRSPRRSASRAGGGAGGIRTLDRALQPYNGLANRRLQPLGHSSDRADMPDAGASRKRQISGCGLRKPFNVRTTPNRGLATNPQVEAGMSAPPIRYARAVSLLPIIFRTIPKSSADTIRLMRIRDVRPPAALRIFNNSSRCRNIRVSMM